MLYSYRRATLPSADPRKKEAARVDAEHGEIQRVKYSICRIEPSRSTCRKQCKQRTSTNMSFCHLLPIKLGVKHFMNWNTSTTSVGVKQSDNLKMNRLLITAVNVNNLILTDLLRYFGTMLDGYLVMIWDISFRICVLMFINYHTPFLYINI